jgi:phosphopantetheinyl transferase (holo-ACP synthase)
MGWVCSARTANVWTVTDEASRSGYETIPSSCHHRLFKPDGQESLPYEPVMQPEELLVRRLAVAGEPVFVARMPERHGERDRRASSTMCLWMARLLWSRFVRERGIASADSETYALTVAKDSLGKPQLCSGSAHKASVSFSRGGSTAWAALAAPEWSVGIDTAAPVEFDGAAIVRHGNSEEAGHPAERSLGLYPFHRVFHDGEFSAASACTITAGDRPEVAAFLWSVKEAVTKALGCGFHLVAPMDVQVAEVGCSEATVHRERHNSSEPRWERLHSERDTVSVLVRLSGKVFERFPRVTEKGIQVASWRDVSGMLAHREDLDCLELRYEQSRNAWVSIAMVPEALVACSGMESLRACITDQ